MLENLGTIVALILAVWFIIKLNKPAEELMNGAVTNSAKALTVKSEEMLKNAEHQVNVNDFNRKKELDKLKAKIDAYDDEHSDEKKGVDL